MEKDVERRYHDILLFIAAFLVAAISWIQVSLFEERSLVLTTRICWAIYCLPMVAAESAYLFFATRACALTRSWLARWTLVATFTILGTQVASLSSLLSQPILDWAVQHGNYHFVSVNDSVRRMARWSAAYGAFVFLVFSFSQGKSIQTGRTGPISLKARAAIFLGLLVVPPLAFALLVYFVDPVHASQRWEFWLASVALLWAGIFAAAAKTYDALMPSILAGIALTALVLGLDMAIGISISCSRGNCL